MINILEQLAEAVNLVMYWKGRCKAAENFIAKSPCDPDIFADQREAYAKWQEFVKREPKVGG